MKPLTCKGFFYRATLFVSAVFAVARCPSVCLSVCHIGGLYSDGWRYGQTFCSAWCAYHSSFFDPQRRYPIPRRFRGNPSAGRKIHWGEKNLRLSTEMAVYLGNGTR